MLRVKGTPRTIHWGGGEEEWWKRVDVREEMARVHYIYIFTIIIIILYIVVMVAVARGT